MPTFAFHLARGIQRAVVLAFLVLCGGRPSYGMDALLLARTLLAGFIIGLTFIHNSAGPGLYYLAGTYYQDLDKRAVCNSTDLLIVWKWLNLPLPLQHRGHFDRQEWWEVTRGS